MCTVETKHVYIGEVFHLKIKGTPLQFKQIIRRPMVISEKQGVAPTYGSPIVVKESETVVTAFRRARKARQSRQMQSVSTKSVDKTKSSQ